MYIKVLLETAFDTPRTFSFMRKHNNRFRGKFFFMSVRRMNLNGALSLLQPAFPHKESQLTTKENPSKGIISH